MGTGDQSTTESGSRYPGHLIDERLDEFIIGCFKEVPQEDLLETTLLLAQALHLRLAALIRTLEASNRVEPGMIAQLVRGAPP